MPLRFSTLSHCLLMTGGAALLLGALPSADAAPGSGPVVMVPHRAVYDMTLGSTRTGSSVSEVQGRMVFEITGSTCEGYTQTMRFVTRMSTSEGQPTVSDLRSTTFEDGAATTFRFDSTQFRDQKPVETAVGEARRPDRETELKVELTKPEKKNFELGKKVFLPVQHSIALVEAARSGAARLNADLFDGSENGDKVYETTARIGAEVPVGGNKKLAEVKNAEPLDLLPAWPVSMSFYEKGSDKTDAAPVYEMGYLFYENGVSRKLVIDYGDFSIKGDLKEITFLDNSQSSASCAAPAKP